MPRYKLIVEYDGAPFNGWQRQPDQPTVQGAIEQAVLKCSQEDVTIGSAGRTDAGVHATGQVAHLSLEKQWESGKLREALSFHLKPLPVSILHVEETADDFDARFSAKSRHYRYRIINRRATLTLDAGRAWHVKRELDAKAMHEAAQCLIGHHDFTTFRHVHCQAKTPIKTLDQLDVERQGDDIFITASARSFLHNQVRSLAGCLVFVGDGHWTKTDLENALHAKDRTRCAPVAPAHGLYLYKVGY
ncbi:MAG: tRNA pseudouridine(38-40) synthase TruA [Hyphomicrobiales bacterium]